MRCVLVKHALSDDVHLEIENALDGGDVGLESFALIEFTRVAVNEETFARLGVLQHRLLEQRQHRLLQRISIVHIRPVRLSALIKECSYNASDIITSRDFISSERKVRASLLVAATANRVACAVKRPSTLVDKRGGGR